MLALLNARALDNKVRASDPLARALHGHALTAGTHLDLPSKSFSWAVSACSSSGRDTGGQRRRAQAGLSFCHLTTEASKLMLKISHIASIYPESVSRPLILHVLPTSLLCFLTLLLPQSPASTTAASQHQDSYSGSYHHILV